MDEPVIQLADLKPPHATPPLRPGIQLGLFGLARAILWTLSAAIYVAAPFAEVVKVQQGSTAAGFTTGWNGWGKASVTQHGQVQVDAFAGPNYGRLLYLCAGILLVATVLTLFGDRRRTVQAQWLGCVGGALGLGVTAAQYAVSHSYRSALFGSSSAAPQLGPAIWLAAIASAVALLPILLVFLRRDPDTQA